MKIKAFPILIAVFISHLSLLFSIPFFNYNLYLIFLFTGIIFVSSLIVNCIVWENEMKETDSREKARVGK